MYIIIYISIKKENCMKKLKSGFTLAELLITLSVIGVVAALTLPTLLVKLGDNIRNYQKSVFEHKLSKGTDLLNIDNGIGPYYSGEHPTLDFVTRLSEHMKIVTICDGSHLDNCFTYDEIQIPQSDGSIKTFKVEDIKNGNVFQMQTAQTDAEYKDVAGIVLADGTPMLLTWNVNCPVSDPDKVEYSTVSNKKTGESKSNTTACIKGIYDLNGNKGPNIFGKDVKGFGVVGLGSTAKITEIAGVKWLGELFTSDGVYLDEYCTENNGTWTPNSAAAAAGITQCCTSCTDENMGKDRWAGAMLDCKAAGGRLPDYEQLLTLAKYLYNNDNLTWDYYYGDITLDTSKITGTIFEGIDYWEMLWMDIESSENEAYSYRFYYDSSFLDVAPRNRVDDGAQARVAAICVAD